jgi:Fe-S cluster biosynthesis and repair protein YggX
VAGRYLVARFEIGAVTTPLRTIVIRELEKHLKAWGVEYAFPAADQITNHKDAIEAMLAAVESKHPGKGVLIVIDELLDYLKALGEGAISAFGFLREIGEASGNGRFRVIAGVQESLISSPSFGFLSQLIQKVSARFAEVWITRQDLAFVVESRLLAKTPEQRERIRQHLEKFMPLFPTMSAQKDDFIRLFPVHPRYLQIFEEIDIAEKREVLRTLSQEMNRLLDQDVPTDDPGLIAYDSYWRVIKKTPTLLASPTVGEVEERSAVVASKIQTSFPKAGYRPAAARIIDALSVYRLAVGGIRTPIGLSSTDLRDDLALMLPVPEKDPDFLNTTIESVLRDVVLTVGGQFVSKNEAGQYYLDLDKAIDYDAQVDKKVSSLNPVPEIYDRYYFDILTRVLDTTATTHVPDRPRLRRGHRRRRGRTQEGLKSQVSALAAVLGRREDAAGGRGSGRPPRVAPADPLQISGSKCPGGRLPGCPIKRSSWLTVILLEVG